MLAMLGALESVIAVIAALALAMLSYTFFSQRQEEFGVLHAMGYSRWWLVLRHLCLPLLVSALRTAHCLSLSMEGRAFGLHPHRTYMRPVIAGWRDVGAAAALAVTVTFAIWYRFTAAGVS